MVAKFNTRLLFADTDSFCDELHEKIHKKIYKHKELFDLSNYPKNSRYYCSDKNTCSVKWKMNMVEN